MRVSVKLWGVGGQMIAVITPPFTPAHPQSLPSTVIQSGKQFHCWKLKMNLAFFFDLHSMKMVCEISFGQIAHMSSLPTPPKLLHLA